MLAFVLVAAMQVIPAIPAGAPDSAAIMPVAQVLELEVNPAAPAWNGSLRAKLVVRRPARRFAFRLRGPEPSRVELEDAGGHVPLAFGWHGQDTLFVETVDTLAAGPAAISISFTGRFEPSGPGLTRSDDRHAHLERAAQFVAPLWPDGTPDTPWRLVVHAPATCDVDASLPRATRSLQRDWGTWEFSSGGPVPVDSLRADVRPLAPRPAAKRGGATHRRSRRH